MASSTTSTPLQRTVAMEEDINNFFSSKPINWMFAQVAFPEFIAKEGNPLVEKNFLFRYDGTDTSGGILHHCINLMRSENRGGKRLDSPRVALELVYQTIAVVCIVDGYKPVAAELHGAFLLSSMKLRTKQYSQGGDTWWRRGD